MKNIKTHIAHTTADRIVIRGADLVEEIIGKRSFTEMLYFLSVGRMPSAPQVALLDACLVTLMEHGWTPSAVITRLLLESVPDEMQVALAGGLLAMGPVYAGTSENCAELLSRICEAAAPAEVADSIVLEHRRLKKTIPGFGHPLHKPDDPRALRLLECATAQGMAGKYVSALRALSAAVDRNFSKHITINATGAIAALLLEAGFPANLMRGIAVVSRAGGLVGHVKEERQTGTSREIWRAAEEAFPYAPEQFGD